eukprot:SAG22_NODE_13_length_33548_cov_57.167773_32_plen_166_part_00
MSNAKQKEMIVGVNYIRQVMRTHFFLADRIFLCAGCSLRCAQCGGREQPVQVRQRPQQVIGGGGGGGGGPPALVRRRSTVLTPDGCSRRMSWSAALPRGARSTSPGPGCRSCGAGSRSPPATVPASGCACCRRRALCRAHSATLAVSAWSDVNHAARRCCIYSYA